MEPGDEREQVEPGGERERGEPGDEGARGAWRREQEGSLEKKVTN